MPQGSNFRRYQPWVIAGVLVAFTTGFERTAFALNDSDKEAIRVLSNEAATDFNRNDYAAARDKFTRAYTLAKVPKLAVWVARAQEKLGKLVSAYEYYRQAIRLERSELWIGDAQELAQKDAEKELATLVPRLPKVTITIEGASPGEVEVRIDGARVPAELLGIERYLDPGKREFVAIRGESQLRQIVELPEGGARNIVLRFDASKTLETKGTEQTSSATVPSSTVVVAAIKTKTPGGTTPAIHSDGAGRAQRTWGWATVGVGAAGLITGTVTGLIVAAKYSDLKDDCPGGICAPNDQGRLDSYRSMRTLSLAGFVVGGVGAALGVTLLLTSPKRTESVAHVTSVGLWVTPELAGFRGNF